MGNRIPSKKRRKRLVLQQGRIADRLPAHHPQDHQLLQQRTHRMMFAGVQIGADLLQILSHLKVLQRTGNQRHPGLRSDRFSIEGDLGFSLREDFTRTAFFAMSCLHPFDDPFLVGRPRLSSQDHS